MKKIVMCVLMILVATFAFAGGSSNVADQGSLEIDAVHQFGNSDVGGWVRGNVNADYRAEDRRDAWGNAVGEVELSGKSHEGEHFAVSSASGRVESSAEAKGLRESEVNINGELKQANWTLLEKGGNFSEAWNKTSASYEGGMDRRGITTAEGSAEVEGKSFSFLKATPTETKAASGTFGSSEGKIRTEHSDPTVNGQGQVILGISKITGNTAAFVSAEGNFNYGAQGPRQAQGEGSALTKGTITLLPNGIKATSSASSASSASAK